MVAAWQVFGTVNCLTDCRPFGGRLLLLQNWIPFLESLWEILASLCLGLSSNVHKSLDCQVHLKQRIHSYPTGLVGPPPGSGQWYCLYLDHKEQHPLSALLAGWPSFDKSAQSRSNIPHFPVSSTYNLNWQIKINLKIKINL